MYFWTPELRIVYIVGVNSMNRYLGFMGIMKEVAESKIALIALIIMLVLLFVSVFAPLVSPYNPYDLESLQLENSLQKPMSKEVILKKPLRISVYVGDDLSIEETSFKDVSLEYRKDFDNFVIEFPSNMEFESISVRLPDGLKVVNGTKHPILNKYSVLGNEFTISGNLDLLRDETLNINVDYKKLYTGKIFLLGTDSYGRDMFSSIIYGMRVSVFCGLVSGFIALVIGVFIGLLSSWYGGKIDSFFMRLVDLQMSFPAILVGIFVMLLLGRGLDKMIITLVIVQWSFYVRTVRSVVLVEKSKNYVTLAKVFRIPDMRIMFSELLPNCMPQIIVLATIRIAAAITLESTLSFLGLGVSPTKPSLGLLISNGYEFMLSGKYWISIYPGVALALLIVSVNLFGDRLRDVLNPYLRR